MMKPSVLRICSAFLLMAIAVALSMGMITAAVEQPQEEEETYVWVRLPIKTKPQGEIRLYTAEGQPAERLTADMGGRAVSSLLPVGTYYAVAEDGCCEFSLSEKAEVTVTGGCGRFDGQVLHLDGKKAGSVSLSRQTSGEEWLEYTLSDGKTTLRQAVRCTDGKTAQCVFEGVPFGSYQLRENGVFRCNVVLSEENPDISVAIP